MITRREELWQKRYNEMREYILRVHHLPGGPDRHHAACPRDHLKRGRSPLKTPPDVKKPAHSEPAFFVFPAPSLQSGKERDRRAKARPLRQRPSASRG